ncbi:MAG TPA: reverse transcriptase domain-containing protein [Acidimicrobiales bacterium]|nr:reverse transcriptase domain-containing protein [Acidimicrobiales bacterium]
MVVAHIAPRPRSKSPCVRCAPTGFGFRPKSSAHDALEVIRLAANAGAHWVLDADIKSCFDEIGHEALMALIERRVSDRNWATRSTDEWLENLEVYALSGNVRYGTARAPR